MKPFAVVGLMPFCRCWSPDQQQSLPDYITLFIVKHPFSTILLILRLYYKRFSQK